MENLAQRLVSCSLEDSMLISVPLLNPLGQCACPCQYLYQGHCHCCPSQGIFSPNPYPLLPQTQHPRTQLSIATHGYTICKPFSPLQNQCEHTQWSIPPA